jgi:hypothetical protein
MSLPVSNLKISLAHKPLYFGKGSKDSSKATTCSRFVLELQDDNML